MLLFDCPPSTAQQAPLTRLAGIEERKVTTAATSSGVPKRPRGISRWTKAAVVSGSGTRRLCQDPPSKRIEPGATQLTVTPSRPTSFASEVVKLISADLAALYAGAPPASRPKSEETTTILPHPSPRISGSDRRESRTAGYRLPAMAASSSVTPVSRQLLPARRPRLFTRTWTLPPHAS